MSRNPWGELLGPWRTSHRRAVNAGAREDHHAVLEAIHSFTVGWQKKTDTVTTLQIAQQAGLTRDDWDDKKRTAQARAGRLLAELHDMGAVVYEPRTGRAKASRITLPETDWNLFTDDERSFIESLGRAHDRAPKNGRPGAGRAGGRAPRGSDATAGRASTRAPKANGSDPGRAKSDAQHPLGARSDDPGRAKNGVSNGLGARPHARSRGSSEGLPEEGSEGRAAHAGSASSAGAHAALEVVKVRTLPDALDLVDTARLGTPIHIDDGRRFHVALVDDDDPDHRYLAPDDTTPEEPTP